MKLIDLKKLTEEIENKRFCSGNKFINKLMDNGLFFECEEIKGHYILLGSYLCSGTIFNHITEFDEHGETTTYFSDCKHISAIGLIVDNDLNILKGIVETYTIRKNKNILISNTQMINKSDKLKLSHLIYNGDSLILPYCYTGVSNLLVQLTKKYKQKFISKYGERYYNFITYCGNKTNIVSPDSIDNLLSFNLVERKIVGRLDAARIIGESIESGAQVIAGSLEKGFNSLSNASLDWMDSDDKHAVGLEN